MKSWLHKRWLSTVIAAIAMLLLSACTTSPVPTTPRGETIANAVEDVLAVGLVPVLTKNPSYLPIARGVAATLGTFSGASLTPEDVDAFVARTTIAEDDKRVIAGTVNAAWSVFQRRYAEQVGASVRPDVKLFLTAVANGIERAIAAVPKTTASTDFVRPPTFYWTFNGRRNAVLTETDLRILNGASMVVTKDN